VSEGWTFSRRIAGATRPVNTFDPASRADGRDRREMREVLRRTGVEQSAPTLSRPTVIFRSPALLALAVALSAGACSDSASSGPDAQAVGPLTSIAGDSAAVSLTSTVRQPRSGERLPTLSFTGGVRGVTAVWELRSGPCMIASAEARRSDEEIVIWIQRGGDPVALCVAGEVVYRYEAHVTGVPAGRYRVRIIEQPVEQRAREVGAGEVTVAGG
jgi:hypothetical protein